MVISFKEVSSVKKLPMSKGVSFLELIFDRNEICKMLLTQNY